MSGAGARDPRVDAYIAASAEFARPVLAHLRDRLHAVCPDLEEAIKWGMPAFLYRGRLFANMAAFKAHMAFNFWRRRDLATGREGEAMGQFGRIERLSDLPPDAEIDALIRASAARMDAGIPQRAPRPRKPEATVPPALAAALAADPAAHATFYDRFAPSHRREYCEWIANAKRDETRARRVAQTLEWLRAGRQRSGQYRRS